jgi:hypothetical protein
VDDVLGRAVAGGDAGPEEEGAAVEDGVGLCEHRVARAERVERALDEDAAIAEERE